MSLLAAIGSAVAQAAGPLIATAGQLYTNYQNLKNQDYWNNVAVELANTAHQREVKDLEAAGLNPILSSGGSGAATPSLRAATVANPTSAFGSSARSLGDALTGRIAAENERAQAEASSARAYAERSEDMAQHQEEILAQEASRGRVSSLNQVIDDGARMEALTGSIPSTVADAIDWKDKKAVKAYNDLVQQYRNQAEQGRYNASVGRSIFNDVMSGASSAAGIYNQVRGRPGVNKSRTVNNYNVIGGFEK